MRRRLVTVVAATTAMVALAFVIPLSLLVGSVARQRATADAREATRIVAPALASGDTAAIEVALATAAARGPGPLAVVLADGQRLGPASPDAEAVARARGGRAFSVPADGGLALYTPVVTGPDRVAVVHAVVPESATRRGVTRAWLVLGALGVALVAAAVALADRLGATIVGPTRRAAEVARTLAAGDLDARVPVGGPPEVAAVGTALNRLAERITDLLRAEREAAADLSHRLRTPLTALRVEVGTLRDTAVRTRLDEALSRLEQEVDRVIRETRDPETRRVARTDVARTVRERVVFWSALAEEEGRDVTSDIPPQVLARAAPDDLAEALDALLGNVLTHTPEGTALHIAVEDTGRVVRITVDDEGPGFGTELLDRGASAGGSTGLGLDIAARAARDSGGRLRTETRPGGGARVVLELPRPPAAGNEDLAPT